MNDQQFSAIHEYQGHKYLIPPHSHYIAGDVFELESLLYGEMFNVVVMDPPWHNKHIRRKRHARGTTHG